MAAPPLEFASLRGSDLSLLRAWLHEPHVLQWFGDPAEWLEEIETNLAADCVSYFRVDPSTLLRRISPR
ncbi:MAG: hypothetical protein ACKVS6_10475 [Planctomycetota bacterium]